MENQKEQIFQQKMFLGMEIGNINNIRSIIFKFLMSAICIPEILYIAGPAVPNFMGILHTSGEYVVPITFLFLLISMGLLTLSYSKNNKNLIITTIIIVTTVAIISAIYQNNSNKILCFEKQFHYVNIICPGDLWYGI